MENMKVIIDALYTPVLDDRSTSIRYVAMPRCRKFVCADKLPGAVSVEDPDPRKTRVEVEIPIGSRMLVKQGHASYPLDEHCFRLTEFGRWLSINADTGVADHRVES